MNYFEEREAIYKRRKFHEASNEYDRKVIQALYSRFYCYYNVNRINDKAGSQAQRNKQTHWSEEQFRLSHIDSVVRLEDHNIVLTHLKEVDHQVKVKDYKKETTWYENYYVALADRFTIELLMHFWYKDVHILQNKNNCPEYYLKNEHPFNDHLFLDGFNYLIWLFELRYYHNLYPFKFKKHSIVKI